MKKIKIEIKWAIIYTLMTLLWALIGKLLGFHNAGIVNNLLFNILIIIPSVIIYIFALKEKKNTFYARDISYRECFISGLFLTLFITLLGPLYPVFANIISPDLYSNSIQFFTANKTMTEAEAIKQFNLGNFIFQGLWAALLFGLVYTAIISLFLKSKKSQ
jgi:hypothetical protein